jgi:hypothetical protein
MTYSMITHKTCGFSEHAPDRILALFSVPSVSFSFSSLKDSAMIQPTYKSYYPPWRMSRLHVKFLFALFVWLEATQLSPSPLFVR